MAGEYSSSQSSGRKRVASKNISSSVGRVNVCERSIVVDRLAYCTVHCVQYSPVYSTVQCTSTVHSVTECTRTRLVQELWTMSNHATPTTPTSVPSSPDKSAALCSVLVADDSGQQVVAVADDAHVHKAGAR